MRNSITALIGVFILATVSLAASAGSYWWAPSSDIDWDGLADEVSQIKLDERQMGEFIAYEESLFEERMRWVGVAPNTLTYVGSPLIPPEREKDGRSPEFCYDFWQRGDVPLTPEIASALQVEASPLPHWTELSRTERLQLFATFPAPETRMPVPAVRAPLHLALAVQMGPAGVDEAGGLPQLLELAFGDIKSAEMLRSERRQHHNWEQRFLKRWLRFIANQQTRGFFEPWHEEFSAGNAYIRRITDEKALAAVEKAYCEANPEVLTKRIQLHPTYIAVPEWERQQADSLPVIRTRNYRFDPLFLGAVTTGELGEWCAFYYFRVYGESRTIAEGLLVTPKPEAIALRDLVVHVQSADGKPCAGALVNLENGPYVFLRSEICSDAGTIRIGHVPAYVRDGINYMVMYDEKVYPNVAPEILAPTEDGAVEVVLTLE